MPAMRNMPPYSSVSRIRIVGRNQGYARAGSPGSQVGFGGAGAGGAGGWRRGSAGPEGVVEAAMAFRSCIPRRGR
jgi:hypothetical protein